jgi:hypothetical protein
MIMREDILNCEKIIVFRRETGARICVVNRDEDWVALQSVLESERKGHMFESQSGEVFWDPDEFFFENVIINTIINDYCESVEHVSLEKDYVCLRRDPSTEIWGEWGTNVNGAFSFRLETTEEAITVPLFQSSYAGNGAQIRIVESPQVRKIFGLGTLKEL